MANALLAAVFAHRCAVRPTSDSASAIATITA